MLTKTLRQRALDLLSYALLAIGFVLCGCTTVTLQSGTVRSFGVTHVASIPVQGVGISDPAGETVSISTLGVWWGKGGGVGYRSLSEASFAPTCKLLVFAKNIEQLRAFVDVMKASGITGESICVGSS